LAPFKRDAGEFGVKASRVADRGVGIVQILVALGEEALDEGVGLRVSSFDCAQDDTGLGPSSFDYAQDDRAGLSPSTALRVTRKEERFEGGFRGRGGRETLRARRPRGAPARLRS
jgi:hypothetical protein